MTAIVANNITHEKEQQERINHLAFFDTLTGLRNRFSFEQELNNAEARRIHPQFRTTPSAAGRAARLVETNLSFCSHTTER